jgi:putative ATP-dependent endonuclease of OLD family
MVIVEGITDAILVRQFGRAWASGDPAKLRFIDALTNTIMGTKVGRWPVDLLATPGEEIVGRVAILTDTDKRQGETFTPPTWITDRDTDIVRGFYSAPTLEPAVTPGNEDAVAAAISELGMTPTLPLDPAHVDAAFRGAGGRRKGEFSLALAAELSRRLSTGDPIAVPDHFRQMFDYLYLDEESGGANPSSADL